MLRLLDFRGHVRLDEAAQLGGINLGRRAVAKIHAAYITGGRQRHGGAVKPPIGDRIEVLMRITQEQCDELDAAE